MKRGLGTLVGTRKLLELGSHRDAVTVKLGKPRKAADGDWECPYQITGLRSREIQYAHGIDSIQALLMAMEGIRTTLEKSGKQFSWAGGEPGTGIPRSVPLFFGLDFARRLDRLIDREVERFARTAEARHRRSGIDTRVAAGGRPSDGPHPRKRRTVQ